MSVGWEIVLDYLNSPNLIFPGLAAPPCCFLSVICCSVPIGSALASLALRCLRDPVMLLPRRPSPFSSISVELSAPRLHDCSLTCFRQSLKRRLLRKVFLKLSIEKSPTPSRHQHSPLPCYAFYCPLLEKWKLTKNLPEPEGIQ